MYFIVMLCILVASNRIEYQEYFLLVKAAGGLG